MKLQEQILNIKSIMSEQDRYSKFIKGNPSLQEMIVGYLTEHIKDGYRKTTNKGQNYGNLSEEWCVDGVTEIRANYYFEDGKFVNGLLLISPKLVEYIKKFFSVRHAYVLYVIEEWYDDVMVPKFEKHIGEKGLAIQVIDVMDSERTCVPAPEKPEGITDEEMIKFIVNNTLYSYDDVTEKLDNPDFNLDDLYLNIVDTVNTKRITGI